MELIIGGAIAYVVAWVLSMRLDQGYWPVIDDAS